jgi:hypothetical protein
MNAPMADKTPCHLDANPKNVRQLVAKGVVRNEMRKGILTHNNTSN